MNPFKEILTQSVFSKEDLIRHFVSYEFNRMLQYYEGAKDINVSGNADESEGKKSRRRDREGREREERGGRENRERGERRRDDNDFAENRQ